MLQEVLAGALGQGRPQLESECNPLQLLLPPVTRPPYDDVSAPVPRGCSADAPVDAVLRCMAVRGDSLCADRAVRPVSGAGFSETTQTFSAEAERARLR